MWLLLRKNNQCYCFKSYECCILCFILLMTLQLMDKQIWLSIHGIDIGLQSYKILKSFVILRMFWLTSFSSNGFLFCMYLFLSCHVLRYLFIYWFIFKYFFVRFWQSLWCLRKRRYIIQCARFWNNIRHVRSYSQNI